MANSIASIQTEILTEAQSQYSAIGVNFDPATLSKYDVEQLWSYVIAVTQNAQEVKYDAHKAEVLAIIKNQKAHQLAWYKTKALAFQYGYNLVVDQDYYDNTALTEQQVLDSKVVAYAAATVTKKKIRLKVARLVNGDLAPLSGPQLAAFQAYMEIVKDAGVKLSFTNTEADSLKLDLTIYYNALVLDATGARTDGTDATPVQSAITSFLQNQPFNGLYVNELLIDKLQQVEGVVIPKLNTAQARYGVVPYASIAVEYLPDAGYLRIKDPGDLTLTFIAHEPI